MDQRPGDREILHVDLDAFYASVEQRDDPALRGRPVIVGGPARRGVVCAASYEARPFGVRSAMPMARALALCPDAVVVAPRMRHYAEVSRGFFGILESFSPLVEGLSLDEAFLDVTAVRRLFGDGVAVARQIKTRVRDELSLVASVGVAPSKFVAKIASDLRKPDGLVVVPRDGINEFLRPLPVARLWGVGQVTERALAGLGIATIGDVAETPVGFLQARVGNALGEHLAGLARGEDPRQVEPDRDAVSIGHEDTFATDVRDRGELAIRLIDQGDRVAARLRATGVRARVLTLKIKYADFTRTSRRLTLTSATSDAREIQKAVRALLAKVPGVETRAVRLTGVSASDFESLLPSADGVGTTTQAGPTGQLALFLAAPFAAAAPPSPPPDRLGPALDGIAARFGAGAIRRAVHLDDDE